MVKHKELIFVVLILFFLLFSFYPTIFELYSAKNLADPNREFILEHNYYWPDFNLYLSKIRQGWEGHFTALEKYTGEKHQGSLIQEFYVILGHLGRSLSLDPNFSYQFGRLIFSPLLLFVILILIKYFFKSFSWQLLAFLIVITSGSFPRLYTDGQSILHVGRYMEWWSNIDALQRLTFIPHILFGQVVSFYLLYQLVIRVRPLAPLRSDPIFIFYILLGNTVGLVFPPSLITLIGVLIFITGINIISNLKSRAAGKAFGDARQNSDPQSKPQNHENNIAKPRVSILETDLSQYDNRLIETRANWPMNIQSKQKLRSEKFDTEALQNSKKFVSEELRIHIIFATFTLPSLLYIFLITKHLPWSALVEFHRTHPMMIPFDQYFLGTGPIFILGIFGAMVSIFKRERRWQPLILWILTTFSFAVFFSVMKEQSPLRFTQTGLFIPLGILGTYFFQQIFSTINSKFEARNPKQYQNSNVQFASWRTKSFEHLDFKHLNLFRILDLGFRIFILIYLLSNLYMMKVSLNWQTTWITQRLGASIPPVPYPPQTMYPLRAWMDGIRWLRDNTSHTDVVLAEITAGNYIPAYSGNTVYFGQANTVDYERKQVEVDKFFAGKMSPSEVTGFLKRGWIKYIFFSLQEKEKGEEKDLSDYYPQLKLQKVFDNPFVTIYTLN